MLSIFVKYSIINGFKRIITLGCKDLNCKRLKNKEYAMFAERFRGAAKAHANCFSHTPTDHERQEKSIIMLENSQKSDTAYTNLFNLLDDNQKGNEYTANLVSIATNYVHFEKLKVLMRATGVFINENETDKKSVIDI